VCRKLAVLATAVAAAVVVGMGDASASRQLRVGIYDDAEIRGTPARAFPMLRQLRAKVVRVTMWWGGGPAHFPVATRRPAEATDPADPAYDWFGYDRLVRHAARNNISVMFSIVGTPRWASGSRNWNRVPRRLADLRNFAYAAATRYGGTFTPAGSDEPLPAVRLWLAWNEPNNPVFLLPQFKRLGARVVRGRRVVRWRVQSGRDYARICNAVVAGVKTTLLRNERVGCGVTAPRGNNIPGRRRPSISPLVFLRAMKVGGARGFDAYAHHPYYSKPTETPTRHIGGKNGITLGNINVLVNEVTRLFGRKRIWITEYGYQTRPPDPSYGVAWSKQALYLRQAYRIARRHPRIDMLLWFLLRDEPRLRGRDGWQSGLLTRGGRRKPAFRTFQRLGR
jgi:hypothetical protein